MNQLDAMSVGVNGSQPPNCHPIVGCPDCSVLVVRH